MRVSVCVFVCVCGWSHWPMVIDCFLFRSVKHTHKHTTAEVFVCVLGKRRARGFSFCWISLFIRESIWIGKYERSSAARVADVPTVFPFVRKKNFLSSKTALHCIAYIRLCLCITNRKGEEKTVGNKLLYFQKINRMYRKITATPPALFIFCGGLF
jgi:hypothetical protein